MYMDQHMDQPEYGASVPLHVCCHLCCHLCCTSVAMSVAISVAKMEVAQHHNDKACMLPAAVPKKKLEAEPGARRMRRKITWTRPDGTVAIKEIIYTQQHDQDKVCSAFRVSISGCVLEGLYILPIHSHIARSHKITRCMLTLCLVTTDHHRCQCHWELPPSDIM